MSERGNSLFLASFLFLKHIFYETSKIIYEHQKYNFHKLKFEFHKRNKPKGKKYVTIFLVVQER